MVLAAVRLALVVEVPVVADAERGLACGDGKVEGVLREWKDGLAGSGEGVEPAGTAVGEVEGGLVRWKG